MPKSATLDCSAAAVVIVDAVSVKVDAVSVLIPTALLVLNELFDSFV